MAIVGILSIVFTFVPKPEYNGAQTVNGGEATQLEAANFLDVPALSDVEYQWQFHEKSWWFFTRAVAIKDETRSTRMVANGDDKVVSVEIRYTDKNGKAVVVDSGELPAEIILMFLLCMLISLALGPKSPLTWSMYADAADYNEWRTGRRATAMTFSAATFAQKLGGTLASAGMLSVLAFFGYVAKEAQSDASQFGIVILQTAIPGFFAILAVFIVKYYTLTGKQLEDIQQDLKDRQAATGS